MSRSSFGGPAPYVNPKVPTVEIRHTLGRVHVGTSDAEVVEMFNNLMNRAPHAGFTPALRKQTIRYALWYHHRNRAEYDWVMGGGHHRTRQRTTLRRSTGLIWRRARRR